MNWPTERPASGVAGRLDAPQRRRTGNGRAYLARARSERHAHDRSPVGFCAARIEATTPAGSQWYGFADQDAFGSTTAQLPSASRPTSRTYPAGPAVPSTTPWAKTTASVVSGVWSRVSHASHVCPSIRYADEAATVGRPVRGSGAMKHRNSWVNSMSSDRTTADDKVSPALSASPVKPAAVPYARAGSRSSLISAAFANTVTPCAHRPPHRSESATSRSSPAQTRRRNHFGSTVVTQPGPGEARDGWETPGVTASRAMNRCAAHQA